MLSDTLSRAGSLFRRLWYGYPFGMRRALIFVAVAMSFALAYFAYGRAQPHELNYRLIPTSRCLRARGYVVSRPSSGQFGRRTVEITRHGRFWLVAFTVSPAQAQRNASSDPYGVPTRRNVVFDIESVGLQPQDMAVVGCLRS
jgi:hypothetical protein